MRYWTGAAFLVVGVALLVMAARRRRIGVRREPSSALAGMAAFAEIVRPIVLGFIGFLALKMTMVFVMMGAGAVFAPSDFAGFVFALAGYAVWFWVATTYRPAVARTDGVARERDDVGDLGALRVAAVRVADSGGGRRRARVPETVE